MQMQVAEEYLIVIAIHQQEKFQMERNMNFNANKLVPVNQLYLISHVLYFSSESGVYRFSYVKNNNY